MFAKVERCGALAAAAACFHWKLNQRTVDIKCSLPTFGIAKKKSDTAKCIKTGNLDSCGWCLYVLNPVSWLLFFVLLV